MNKKQLSENLELNRKYTNILIKGSKINLRNLTNFPSEEVIEITEEDYESEYITRYFVKKSNDLNAILFEVGLEQFKTFTTSPFYSSVELRWKIAGGLSSIHEKNIKSTIGVVEHNSDVLDRVEISFRGIKNKIPSVTQFYKK
tara:strand:+ start:32 stop:460 length:429 start_codon:yes stop_codon:yes gene_type:complete